MLLSKSQLQFFSFAVLHCSFAVFHLFFCQNLLIFSVFPHCKANPLIHYPKFWLRGSPEGRNFEVWLSVCVCLLEDLGLFCPVRDNLRSIKRRCKSMWHCVSFLGNVVVFSYKFSDPVLYFFFLFLLYECCTVISTNCAHTSAIFFVGGRVCPARPKQKCKIALYKKA